MSQTPQNHGKNESRDIKQALFVKHLLSGLTITDAAIAAGVSRPTATRWLNLKEVKESLAGGKAEIKKSAHDIIIEKYSDKLEAACGVVTTIAEDKEEPAAARLKAVQMIMDRLAPIIAQPVESSSESTGVLVAHELIPYLTPEEMETIERFIGLAEQRKAQAESDREVLERKRG
jgi:transposase